MPQSMLNLFMGYLHLKLIISRKTPSSSNFIQCDWCQGPNLVFFEIQMSDIAFLGGGRQREGRRAHISGVSNDFPWQKVSNHIQLSCADIQKTVNAVNNEHVLANFSPKLSFILLVLDQKCVLRF